MDRTTRAFAIPFAGDVLSGEAKTRFLAVEPDACPTLTRGTYAYDFGDTAGMTPLMPMYTLGHDFVPAPVHAGGLRYHGDAPSLCGLVKAGLYEAKAYPQVPVFEAAVMFARYGGVAPGPGARARAQGARSMRHWRRARPTRSASCCSTSAGTGTSTSAPTRRFWVESSRIFN